MKLPMIDRLQFISNNINGLSHRQSIHKALRAGCRWIQLRVKNEPPEKVIKMAFEAKDLCKSHGARLIINDFPEIAREVQADGLHLGLEDLDIGSARKIVGNMIIGGTANTWTDVRNRISEGADYIGLGPFRFTKTKQNLSPVVSLDEYRFITSSLSRLDKKIPVIAIGGITADDITSITDAGIYGVAVSGAIIHAENPRQVVSQIIGQLC